jgi:sugar phosphate isomerase/epimerase
MPAQILVKPDIQLGIVPTHLRFVGALVPDENGRFPRTAGGELVTVAGVRELCAVSLAKPTCIQLPVFPGANPADFDELVGELRKLGLEIYFIMMVGGVNPMNPADEDAVVAQLLPSFKSAVKHGIRHVSSTSVEEWMSAEPRREGADFEAAIAQNVKVHVRIYQEAGLEGSCVENWHMEFLRPGEFKTFTSLDRSWAFVSAVNKALGKTFFKQLVDAAHCGDSGLSLDENRDLIHRIAAAGELGIFHASAKTTRGCLSTDDGWIGALLTEMAKSGGLRHVFVEAFDHEDAALEQLRNLEPGHGVDTRDGRTYTEVIADGLADIAHRLNNLAARGFLTV